MVTFSGFYSHSFAPEDKEICKKFEEIIKSFGFELYEHKRRESEPLSKEIIKHIEEKDVFISVITKNSFWLRDESTVAFHEKKPMIIFYEEGLNLGGVLNDNSINKVPFRREYLLNSIIDNGILKTLNYFKESLIGDMYFPFYRKDEIIAYRKIIDENTYEVREKHTITSLNDLTQEIPYTSRVISKNNIDISINQNSFEFKVLKKPERKKIYYDIRRNDKQEFKLIVKINPNLSKNEQLKYQFKYKRKNLKRMFKEQINLIENGKVYPTYKNTYYQRTNVVIEQPTKKIVIRMEFPEDYPIHDYGAYVFLNKTSNRNYDEEKRIKVVFDDNVGGNPYIQLEVKYPKINHNYHLWWEVPSKEEYLRSKK